jgi:hypothetical protein
MTDPRSERAVALRLHDLLDRRRTMILLAVPHERRELEENLQLYDGIVSLEEPELDLARVMGSLIEAPQRRESRMRVRVPALVFAAEDAPVPATAIDLTATGAGLRLDGEVGPEPFRIIFYRGDGRRVALGAWLAWREYAPRDAKRMGVRFVGATLDRVRALHDLAFWEIVRESGGRVIHLFGGISEITSFCAVAALVAQTPVLDLGEVTHVNSAGILRWVEFVQGLPNGVCLRLRRVALAIARQVRLVPALRDRCTIESLYAPYECEECQLEITQLVSPADQVARVECPDCGAAMVLAEPVLDSENSVAPARARRN